MLLPIIKQLLTRDLNKLRVEINAYQQEERIWHIERNIANTAGNLCLHLVGNLNTYIGATLGNTGYVRDRDYEFSAKGITRNELLEKIDATIVMVDQVLSSFPEEKLLETFPVKVFQQSTSIEFMLTHLTTHLAYHLGQINYHRRLLD